MATSANEGDWRNGCSGIVSMLDKARHEARFTDIQFVLKKGKSKKIFNAHKTILACGSPVFENMFYGPMAEKRSVIQTDDDPEAFDILLNHFYGKSNKISSFISVWRFYIIGDKYLVPKIHDIAKLYTESIKITEDDFWDMIDNDVLSHPLFCDKMHPYLKENARSIIKSPNFLSAPENFIDELLQIRALKVSEYDLLVAVTEWGYTNLAAVSSISLLKFYKHIRFSNLTCEEYFRFIDSYPEAIEAKDSLEILQYIYNSYGRCLPCWCTSNQDSREFEFIEEIIIKTNMPPQPDLHMEEVLFDYEDI